MLMRSERDLNPWIMMVIALMPIEMGTLSVKRENTGPVTGMESNSQDRAHTYTREKSIGMTRIEKFLEIKHGRECHS